MDQKAVTHADERLADARRGVEKLRNAESIQEMRSGWSDFLIAVHTIYAKLEQGSKVSDKSKSWFGQMKSFRKTDALLKYLHGSRNTAEHTLIEVTDSHHGTSIFGDVGEKMRNEIQSDNNGRLVIGGSMPDTEFNFSIGPNGKQIVQTRSVGPGQLRTDFTPKRIMIKAFTNRDGVYGIPPVHKGQPLASVEPVYIAELVVKYLSDKIDEARKL